MMFQIIQASCQSPPNITDLGKLAGANLLPGEPGIEFKEVMNKKKLESSGGDISVEAAALAGTAMVAPQASMPQVSQATADELTANGPVSTSVESQSSSAPGMVLTQVMVNAIAGSVNENQANGMVAVMGNGINNPILVDSAQVPAGSDAQTDQILGQPFQAMQSAYQSGSGSQVVVPGQNGAVSGNGSTEADVTPATQSMSPNGPDLPGEVQQAAAGGTSSMGENPISNPPLTAGLANPTADASAGVATDQAAVIGSTEPVVAPSNSATRTTASASDTTGAKIVMASGDNAEKAYSGEDPLKTVDAAENRRIPNGEDMAATAMPVQTSALTSHVTIKMPTEAAKVTEETASVVKSTGNETAIVVSLASEKGLSPSEPKNNDIPDGGQVDAPSMDEAAPTTALAGQKPLVSQVDGDRSDPAVSGQGLEAVDTATFANHDAAAMFRQVEASNSSDNKNELSTLGGQSEGTERTSAKPGKDATSAFVNPVQLASGTAAGQAATSGKGDAIRAQSQTIQDQALNDQGNKKINAQAHQTDVQSETDGHVDTSTLQNSVAVSTVQAGAELNNSVNDSSQLTPAHIQQIADEVGLSMQMGKSFVRIQLHPQGLGTIDIHLSTDAKGVGVTIMAEHASTGRLLEGQMDSLRQSLTDAGLNLSHIDLGMKGQQNGQGGQQSTQSNQTGTGHEWSARQWNSEANKKYAGTSQQLTLTPSSINYQV